jgi:succinate dehydrogenase / fumarate reductase cytochrome b subunit
MSWFVTYVRSSVGAKHVMAVTGLLLLLFTLVHMIGHWVMFGGQDAYNGYAYWLQSLGHGGAKWVARAGLLGLLLAHVAAGIRLTSLNRAARPVPYRVYRTVRTRPWAKAMVWSGLVVLAFITFHILHFTAGLIQPESFHQPVALPGTPEPVPNAYLMFVHGFQNPGILVAYIVGMSVLLPHAAHGFSSLFQSLGWKHPKYDVLIDKAGPALAVLLYVGFLVPPIAVALNVITLPGA